MADQLEKNVENEQPLLVSQLRLLKEQRRRARTWLALSLVVHFTALVLAIVTGVRASKFTEEIARVEADMKGLAEVDG